MNFSNLAGRLGKWLLGEVSFYSGLLSLLYFAVVKPFAKGSRGNRFIYPITIQQVYFTGVQAGGLISMIAFALGVAIIAGLHSSPVNVNAYLGKILVIAVIQTLGPLVTAIIVIARSGTAISTEIANMVIRNEILALEAMAIDTLNFLVLPRILGMVISLLCLNLIFSAVSVLGGVAVAWIFDPNMDLALFFNNFFESLTWGDLAQAGLKSVFFGCGISLVCMINGFKVLMYPGGVPVSGIKGVVGSLQWVFVINAVLTVLFII